MKAVLSATRIEPMRASDVPALRAFLASRPDATVFHSPDWLNVIGAAYGHACDYWLARQGGDISGVFPVLHVRAPLLGSKMVAMAYQMDSGMPLADAETTRAMVERAAAEARRRRVRYLEIRSLRDAPELEALGFCALDSGLVTTIVPLEGMTLPRVRRNHRRGLRSAEELGVHIVESRAPEDLRRFRRLYLNEGRAIGAPQAGRRYFESLHRHGAPLYRLYLAWRDSRCIAGMVTLGDDRVTYARHAAYSSPEALQVHAGTALYWRAIQDAASLGSSLYNCGISWVHDTGLVHWKEGWSGESVAVRIYVLPITGDAPAPGAYLGGFRLARAAWRRLPLPVAELGGQLVTRWVC